MLSEVSLVLFPKRESTPLLFSVSMTFQISLLTCTPWDLGPVTWGPRQKIDGVSHLTFYRWRLPNELQDTIEKATKSACFDSRSCT
jgi:hypothetical protein